MHNYDTVPFSFGPLGMPYIRRPSGRSWDNIDFFSVWHVLCRDSNTTLLTLKRIVEREPELRQLGFNARAIVYFS